MLTLLLMPWKRFCLMWALLSRPLVTRPALQQNLTRCKVARCRIGKRDSIVQALQLNAEQGWHSFALTCTTALGRCCAAQLPDKLSYESYQHHPPMWYLHMCAWRGSHVSRLVSESLTLQGQTISRAIPGMASTLPSYFHRYFCWFEDTLSFTQPKLLANSSFC
jgi:hypothetical protein